MGSSRPNIAIVGGGIGGLFAANALIAHGLQVSVYEQAPALGESGRRRVPDAEQRTPAAEGGAGTGSGEMGSAGSAPDSRYFRHDGAPIAPVQVTDSSGWNATFGMHRADLVDILASALPAGVVHTGHRCTGFEQDGDVARVSFANGAVAEADSSSRPTASTPSFGPTCFLRPHPVFSGSVAYRGVLPHERVPHWPTDSLADVARQRQALPHFPCARRETHQLRRIRAGRRGDEGIVVGSRRPRCASPGVRRLGPAHRVAVAAGADDVPMGPL